MTNPITALATRAARRAASKTSAGAAGHDTLRRTPGADESRARVTAMLAAWR